MKRNIILAGLGLLLIVFIVAAVFGQRDEQGVEVIAEEVPVEDFDTTVTVSGQVEAADAVSVYAAMQGQVVEVAVRQGREVTTGEILARLDDRAAGQALRRAQEALATALAEKERAERNLSSAEDEMERAEDDLARIRRLYEAGVATEQQLTEAQTRRRLAAEQLSAARAALGTGDAGADGPMNAVIRVAMARRDLSQAESELEMTRIRAPQEGIVLVRSIDPGVAVAPGMPLFVIGTTGRLRTKVLVDEAYIVDLQPGQPVAITNEALPGLFFSGLVTAIAPQGQIRDKLALFPVEIELNNIDGKLRPGMTVDCEIRTARAEQVPVVPLLAVFNAAQNNVSKDRYVFVVRNGRAKKVHVELGLLGEAEASVASGLTGGEMVITGEIDTLRRIRDGQAVRVREEARDGE